MNTDWREDHPSVELRMPIVAKPVSPGTAMRVLRTISPSELTPVRRELSRVMPFWTTVTKRMSKGEIFAIFKYDFNDIFILCRKGNPRYGQYVFTPSLK